MDEDAIHGMYGSMAFRMVNRSQWKCYDSSDYTFIGVVDDYGHIVAVSEYKNIRGY